MAKRKKKLPDIPRYTPPEKSSVSEKAKTGTAVAGPELSWIIEGLRPLAVPCDSLVFDPANARTHDERNLDAIRGSLAVYGQRKPLVVRRQNGAVIAGNGTLQAALSLGWTHIAVVFVDDDQATAAGFSIADNRAAELAGWDVSALDKLLEDLNTGNDERLDRMIADLAQTKKLVPDEQPESGEEEGNDEKPPNRFGVLVFCAGEVDQQQRYGQFVEAGHECRMVIVDGADRLKVKERKPIE